MAAELGNVWVLLLYFVAFLLTSLAVVFLRLCIYIHILHRKYAHLPGPKRTSFFFGNLDCIVKMMETTERCFEDVIFYEYFFKYNNTFVLWILHRPLVALFHPKDVRKALITLNLRKDWQLYKNLGFVFGQRLAGYGLVSNPNHDSWQKHRSCINPAFHRKYLKEMLGPMNDLCNEMVDHLGGLADGKTHIRMADIFQRTTMDIIGKVAFNMDVNSLKDPLCPLITGVTTAVNGVAYQLQHPFNKIDIFSFDYQDSVINAVRYLRDTAKKIIDERLQLFHSGEEMPVDILTQILKMSTKDPSITMENLIDEFVTFFIAGQETTANSMAFMLFEISRHPVVLEKLREVQEVMGSKQTVEYDDLPKLQYLGHVFKETLRLYGVAPASARITEDDCELGGFHIPAGARISVSFHAYHKHPEFWTDPEEFNPESLTNEHSEDSSVGCVFIPFSAGPRNCIGQFLAQFEVKVIFVRFLQMFDFELLSGQTGKIQPRITLYPKDGVTGTLKLL